MKFRIIYSNPNGSSYLSQHDTLELAKEAASTYSKVNNIRQGGFIVIETLTWKPVSHFTFPPPPPLEGWVDTKDSK